MINNYYIEIIIKYCDNDLILYIDVLKKNIVFVVQSLK